MVTAADFTAVLTTLGALGGQCLPVADLALGAKRVLPLTPATSLGEAVWLATMTQESGYFRTTTEYKKDGSYAPYIGRTFEQVTWEANYAAFGKWCQTAGLTATADLFVDQPALLGETQWAWLGGVWFFQARDLWPLANAGDFQKVQNAVNRGTATSSGFPSGWDSRLKCYHAWTSQIAKPVELPITGTMDEPTSRRLQQWLGVAMDGDVGSVTYGALQRFLHRDVDGSLSKDDVRAWQTEIGAYVDGDWGKGTTKQTCRYLNANR